MDLIYYPNPILRQSTSSVPIRNEEGIVETFDKSDRSDTLFLKDIVDEMFTLLYKYRGRGLAAPQVNIPYSFFVCILGKDSPTAFVNPRIVGKSKEKIKTSEGCLSIPNITANLNCRYKQVKIEAETVDNRPVEMLLDSYDSVVFQHEFDHLNGITLFQRMGSAQRQLKLNVYKKKL